MVAGVTIRKDTRSIAIQQMTEKRETEHNNLAIMIESNQGITQVLPRCIRITEFRQHRHCPLIVFTITTITLDIIPILSLPTTLININSMVHLQLITLMIIAINRTVGKTQDQTVIIILIWVVTERQMETINTSTNQLVRMRGQRISFIVSSSSLHVSYTCYLQKISFYE